MYNKLRLESHFIRDNLLQNAGEFSVANLDKLRHANGKITTAELRLKMQRCMQNHAAVFRDGPILQKGVAQMNEIYKQFKDIKVIDKCVKFTRELRTLLSTLFTSL